MNKLLAGIALPKVRLLHGAVVTMTITTVMTAISYYNS